MLIVLRQLWDNDRFFSRVRRIAGVGLVAGAVAWTALVALRLEEKMQVDVVDAVVAKRNVDFSLIGSGPLALRSHVCSPYLESICEELVLLGVNTRPDRKMGQTDLLLAFKTAKQEMPIASGTTLFLKDHSGVALKATARGGSGALIELSHLNESVQYLLPVDQDLGGETESYFAALKGGKWHGADQLVATYGGEEYRELKPKQVVEFGRGAPLHVSMGDLLIWNGESWKKSDREQPLQDTPIARIKTITPRGIEVEAWDGKGFSSFSACIENQASAALLKTDGMLLSSKFRSATQVSCVMGKRRMMIKAGDWIVKTSSGWHHLKTAAEIEACIHQRLRGDLLVIEAIEKEEGRGTIRGRLFNDTHTHSQPLSMPITLDKKTLPAKRKVRKR